MAAPTAQAPGSALNGRCSGCKASAMLGGGEGGDGGSGNVVVVVERRRRWEKVACMAGRGKGGLTEVQRPGPGPPD